MIFLAVVVPAPSSLAELWIIVLALAGAMYVAWASLDRRLRGLEGRVGKLERWKLKRARRRDRDQDLE